MDSKNIDCPVPQPLPLRLTEAKRVTTRYRSPIETNSAAYPSLENFPNDREAADLQNADQNSKKIEVEQTIYIRRRDCQHSLNPLMGGMSGPKSVMLLHSRRTDSSILPQTSLVNDQRGTLSVQSQETSTDMLIDISAN